MTIQSVCSQCACSGKTFCQETDHPQHGTRRALKQKNGQDCLFVGDKGCELSMAVRPLVCRLHPYTYDVGGLAAVLDPRCLLGQQKSGDDLVATMGVTSALAQTWHLQLYNEIFTHEGI